MSWMFDVSSLTIGRCRALGVLAVVIKLLLPYLLSNGTPVDILPENRPNTAPVDPNNDSLRFAGGKLTKIYERYDDECEAMHSFAERLQCRKGRPPLLIKPETVVFDDKGVMYIMNENAQLVSLTDFKKSDDNPSILTAKATEIAHLGVGRPLGGKFDKKGCLYFADAIMGLARICNLLHNTDKQSNVELIASRVKLEDGTWSPIAYADDVDIGPKTGHVYFSDASDIHTDRNVDTNDWDFEYSSKVEGLRGKRTGRLLRYRPETGEVDVLVKDGVAFANGVAVDKDETFIIYTSTFEARVMKYRLTDKFENPVKLLDGFTGFLDGADCSYKSGLCYVAIPSTVPPLVKSIFSMNPPWIGRAIRTLLIMIPRTWAPNAEKYGAAAEIHPGDGANTPARILRTFQDPDGRDVEFISGVTEHEGKLYLGSLRNNYVAVVSLD